MKMLALEFSSLARSVAVGEVPLGDAAAGPAVVLASAVETAGRETRAFALIEAVLAQASIEREDLGCLAVGLGPGSYTGIRIALAIAQGWQLAGPVRLLGLRSADAVAAAAQASGVRGTFTVAVDAQRRELYLARYHADDDGWRALDPLRLGPMAEAQALLDGGERVLGPDLATCLPGAQAVVPSAAALLGLAAGRTDFTPGDRLEPVYLRAPSFVKAPAPRWGLAEGGEPGAGRPG